MTIFVTGVTGFIGSHFLERLLVSLGPDGVVYALSRSSYSHPDSRVRALLGDLSEVSRFREELLSSDYVYHIGALAVFGNRLPYDEVNFEPTKAMVSLLQESRRLKNFIFISTIGALDRAPRDSCREPLTPDSSPSATSRYGRSKWKAEEFIRSSGVPYTIIRATWVYGKYMRTRTHVSTFVGMVGRKSPLRRLGFPGRVPLIHVDDLSKALVNCLGNEKILRKVYIAVGENRTIGDIFREISKTMNAGGVMQIPLPSFRPVLGRFHRFLPMSVSNLFLDYLRARDDRFTADFGVEDPVRFSDSVGEVVKDHILHTGFWVVTGAASGIGRALAGRLKALGKKMILIDKDLGNLKAEFEPSESCVLIPSDLSEEDELFALAGTLRKYRLVALIHNAGTGSRGSVGEVPYDRIQKTLDVNFRAPVFLTKALLGRLIHDGTTIVNISSSIAWNPLPGMSLYSASKAALAHWSESLAYELKDTNTVITLYPSGTYTNFQKNAGVRMEAGGRGLLSADYVAKKIVEAVEKGKSVSILGMKTRVLLAVSGCLPRRFKAPFWGKLFENLR